MRVPAVTADLGIEFDTAQYDWWKPIGRAWRLEAAGISVLYGARVGVLGLQLTAAIEFYDRDALDRDDEVRADVTHSETCPVAQPHFVPGVCECHVTCPCRANCGSGRMCPCAPQKCNCNFSERLRAAIAE